MQYFYILSVKNSSANALFVPVFLSFKSRLFDFLRNGFYKKYRTIFTKSLHKYLK